MIWIETAKLRKLCTAMKDDPDNPTKKLQVIMSWVIVGILTTFGTYVLIQLATIETSEKTFWESLLKTQFPVVIALPLSAMGSLFITLILRISVGPLEFEFAGFKFKGGAAPIVFWVICFLAMVLAIKLLWQPGAIDVPETPDPIEERTNPVDSTNEQG